MARYSHKGHDTIRYDITQNIAIRYDPIRKCFTICKNRMYGRMYSSKQVTARNTGAPSFCLSTLLPLQVPGYWPTGEATVSGWPVSLKSRVIQTLHCYYCYRMAAARPVGGRTAQIFSDCAITKYLSRATAFTVNTWTHPGSRAITANLCHFACSCHAARDSLCRCRRGHLPRHVGD